MSTPTMTLDVFRRTRVGATVRIATLGDLDQEEAKGLGVGGSYTVLGKGGNGFDIHDAYGEPCSLHYSFFANGN
ncbi:hypothetical protein ACFLQN_02325 [Candidatus Aenigmatarchaeota archaeon]